MTTGSAPLAAAVAAVALCVAAVAALGGGLSAEDDLRSELDALRAEVAELRERADEQLMAEEIPQTPGADVCAPSPLGAAVLVLAAVNAALVAWR